MAGIKQDSSGSRQSGVSDGSPAVRRSLWRGGARPRIGMLSASLEDSYTSALIRGAADFCESAGIDLLVYVIGGFEALDPERGAFAVVQPELLDGIILTGGLAYRGAGAQSALAAFRDRCRTSSGGLMPLVGTSLWLSGVPAVIPSSYGGMRDVVEHLIDVHGYRSIGFIGGPENSSEATERYRAYEDALKARGLKVDPALRTYGDFTLLRGRQAAEELLDRFGDLGRRSGGSGAASRLPMDALVCASDDTAIGALEALAERGIRVPDDLAVVGFDDNDAASRLPVPLTTVRQPVYGIGYRAASILYGMLSDPSNQGAMSTTLGISDDELIVQTQMVVRRSCGCLPQYVRQAVVAPTGDAPSYDAPPSGLVMFEDLRADIVAELVARSSLVGDASFSLAVIGSDARGEPPTVSSAVDIAVPDALVDAFWAELRAEMSPSARLSESDASPENLADADAAGGVRDSAFVRTLADFTRVDSPELERWDWHEAISVLRRRVVPLLGDRRISTRAEDLLQQARAYIGEARMQAEAYRHAEVEELEERIRTLADEISGLDELKPALDSMEHAMLELSVRAHALVRLVEPVNFDNSVEPGRTATVATVPSLFAGLQRVYEVPAVDGQTDGAVPGEGSVYPLSQLLPQETWEALSPQRRMWIILPLLTAEQALGICLFNGAFDYPQIYQRLRQAVTGAMVRADLVSAQIQARREAESAMHRAEVALRDAMVAQQRYVRQAWRDPTMDRGPGRTGVVRGYERTAEGEGLTEDAWLPAMTQATLASETVVERDEQGETLAVPLTLYGQQVIGTLGFWRPLSGGEATVSWSPEQIRLVENVAGQMAMTLETQRLLSDSRRRAARLAAAAEVSSAATSLTDLGRLLSDAVNLIQERFSLYYAGLFLVDRSRQWAVLVAGTGEPGRIMVERGHRLEVGGRSMIGRCVTSSQAQIASDISTLDTTGDLLWRPNPLLPETRSELALPLVSRGAVIGAMTIQDVRPGAFTEGDVTTLQTMADQLANAIENARLLDEMERTLRQVQLATGTYTQEAWRDFLRERSGALGYSFRLVDVTPSSEPHPEAIAAITQDQVVTVRTQARDESSEQASDGGGPVMTGMGVPIRLRNQVLGALNLRFEGEQVSPEVQHMVEQVAERLAMSLESARLLEESRRTAAREQLVGEVSRRIRQSLEIDEVLQSSVREIREAMDLYKVSVRLAPWSDEE